MMIESLKKLNPEIDFYSVSAPEFSEYGRVLDINTDEIVAVGMNVELTETGAKYDASLEAFEKLDIAKELQNKYFGQLETQVGYCRGHANFLNAWEWHTSSEINIAVTDLVLILGKLSDIKNGMIDSKTAKAFLLKKGEAVEVYATSLHFCPCEVSADGFGCVVALPKGTNTPLEIESEDKHFTHKNKWLIAHVDNKTMIDNGRVPGITGKNFEIKY